MIEDEEPRTKVVFNANLGGVLALIVGVNYNYSNEQLTNY